MPDVTVVVPSFRGGRYLRESVASVQAQTLENWELIVVLDGCDDDLSDIEQSDQRVRVIKQRQRGVSTARNVGIARAQTDLIAFLDDDDRMLPNRLLAQFEAMKDESIGLCHTQFRFIDDDGEPIGPGISKDSQYLDFLRCDGAVFLSSTMTRRSLIQEVGGFNSLLLVGEDVDLVLRIARETTLRFLPEVLAEYRRHGSNVWLDTTSGGRETKLILTQHLWAAEARAKAEDLQALDLGMKTVMTGRAKAAMFRAGEARSRHDHVGLVVALGQSLLLAPRVTIRLVLRALRKDKATTRSR